MASYLHGGIDLICRQEYVDATAATKVSASCGTQELQASLWWHEPMLQVLTPGNADLGMTPPHGRTCGHSSARGVDEQGSHG
jgi:hypothetical protein